MTSSPARFARRSRGATSTRVAPSLPTFLRPGVMTPPLCCLDAQTASLKWSGAAVGRLIDEGFSLDADTALAGQLAAKLGS